MKKIIILLFGAMFLVTGCALHSGLTTNSTEVHLSSNNFKVLERIQGESQATYVLGIGGLKKKALIAEARANMLKKADIVGSSKALVNETIEVKRTIALIIVKYKVIVTAHIVEFE